MRTSNDTTPLTPSARLLAVVALLLLLILQVPISAGNTSSSACRFTPGERLIYRIRLTGDATAHLSSLQLQSQSPSGSARRKMPAPDFHLHVAVAGELVITVIESRATDGGALVVYRLRQPVVSLSINDHEVASQEAAIRNELDSDIFVDVDCQGRIISVRFDPGVANSGDLSQRFARALLAATQFVLSDDGTLTTAARRSWQMKESDPFGFYIALYEATPSHDNSFL